MTGNVRRRSNGPTDWTGVRSMRNRINRTARLVVMLAAVASVAAAALYAQSEATAPAKMAVLTALDYIEIRQLVARYGYAVDTGADNGNMYADLFSPDGAFLDRTGKGTTGR